MRRYLLANLDANIHVIRFLVFETDCVPHYGLIVLSPLVLG